MGDSRLVQDDFVCERQLAIVERYEDFVNYVYPIALNIPNKHAIVRGKFLDGVMDQVGLFNEAGKIEQACKATGKPMPVAKLYVADAGLGTLRFHLRFMADQRRRLISKRQASVAGKHLAETGKMLGAWIKSTGRKG